MESIIFDFSGKGHGVSGEKLRLRKAFELANGKGKDFQVVIRPPKYPKTPKQLRGIYRLWSMIAPVLSEHSGEIYEAEDVKEIIKARYNFTKICHIPSSFSEDGECLGLKKVRMDRSLSSASTKELYDMIKLTEVFGAEMGVEDCFLESWESLSLAD